MYRNYWTSCARRRQIYAVIDSGIFIARAFLEPLAPQCVGLIAYFEKERAELHVPALFKYELVAVCRKIAYQKRVSETIARLQLNDLMSIQTAAHLSDALLIRAYEIAEEYNLPTTYDSQYLALAEQLACEFWTLDERLFNAVSGRFPNIRWVGNWQIEAQ